MTEEFFKLSTDNRIQLLKEIDAFSVSTDFEILTFSYSPEDSELSVLSCGILYTVSNPISTLQAIAEESEYHEMNLFTHGSNFVEVKPLTHIHVHFH